MTHVARRRPLDDAERRREGSVSTAEPPHGTPHEPPPVGSIARDSRTGRVGHVMPRVVAALVRHPGRPILVTLRPPAGGLEWDVPLEHVQSISNAERWTRRCNGQPAEGIPISRRGLLVVLGTSRNVQADGTGTITWSSGTGDFSAEPILA
jgi:hypothetical protein